MAGLTLLETMRSQRLSAENRAELARRLETARERLWAASPGGSAATAMCVSSAAVIEARMAAMGCPHCGGSYRLLEHTRPLPQLRKLDVECRRCSSARALWFALADRESN